MNRARAGVGAGRQAKDEAGRLPVGGNREPWQHLSEVTAPTCLLEQRQVEVDGKVEHAGCWGHPEGILCGPTLGQWQRGCGGGVEAMGLDE